ncbi:MAG: hypothetical protein R6U57_00625 [Anaerolineales bacterium]
MNFALEKHILKRKVMDVETLERPFTVIEGRNYLFEERGISGEPSEYHEVTFLAYSPSAAQLVVGRNGAKMVVDRRDLFIKPDFYNKRSISSRMKRKG